MKAGRLKEILESMDPDAQVIFEHRLGIGRGVHHEEPADETYIVDGVVHETGQVRLISSKYLRFDEWPTYIKPPPHLSLEYHGSFPQAGRVATAEGHRPGGREWWDRIREIREHWKKIGVLDADNN